MQRPNRLILTALTLLTLFPLAAEVHAQGVADLYAEHYLDFIPAEFDDVEIKSQRWGDDPPITIANDGTTLTLWKSYRTFALRFYRHPTDCKHSYWTLGVDGETVQVQATKADPLIKYFPAEKYEATIALSAADLAEEMDEKSSDRDLPETIQDFSYEQRSAEGDDRFEREVKLKLNGLRLVLKQTIHEGRDDGGKYDDGWTDIRVVKLLTTAIEIPGVRLELTGDPTLFGDRRLTLARIVEDREILKDRPIEPPNND